MREPRRIWLIGRFLYILNLLSKLCVVVISARSVRSNFRIFLVTYQSHDSVVHSMCCCVYKSMVVLY